MVRYYNSLSDITEKYIVIAKYLPKYIICLETTLRIHRVYAAMPCSHQRKKSSTVAKQRTNIVNVTGFLMCVNNVTVVFTLIY